ncbi:MAG: AraC family transcriptional regulator ligand-binding domain-containing protein [Alphaproteobacteria bacterium]|nr:AraC family transcriptional regulator ligand-binding domain-containing protein [Alphaproteobacteria bacterium]
MPHHVVSTAFIERVVLHARGLGLDVESLAHEAGLAPDHLELRGSTMKLSQAFAFFDAVVRAANDPCLGLHIAETATMRTYGVTGFVLANHERLDEGLRDVCVISNALNTGFEFDMVEEGDLTRVELDVRSVEPGARVFLQDVLCGMYRRGVELTGGDWTPAGLEVTGPSHCVDTYTRVVRCSPTFDADVDAIVFRTSDLQRSVPGADPTLLAHLHEAVQTQLAKRRAAAGGEGDLLQLRSCVVDFQRGEVLRHGQRLHLTTKERDILRYLADRPNEVVRHEDIEREVWQLGRHVVSHAPAVAIRRLRQKLEDDPANPVNLVTVFGEGWRLEVPG